MPCNSDYLDPTRKEQELQRTAKLLVYVLGRVGTRVPSWVKAEAENQYAKEEAVVPTLCDLLKKIQATMPETFDKVVYNAKDKVSRDLADWWEEHEAADQARIAREQAERHRQELIASATSKLTRAEREALGIK